jgi:hypothetical protein
MALSLATIHAVWLSRIKAPRVRHHRRQLRPPRPDHPVAELSQEQIKRLLVLGGLINEYERAAWMPRSGPIAEFWNPTGTNSVPGPRGVDKMPIQAALPCAGLPAVTVSSAVSPKLSQLASGASHPRGAPLADLRAVRRARQRTCGPGSTGAPGRRLLPGGCRAPLSTATGACPVPAPAGGRRSPQRICPCRARPTPADCRPAGSASLSLRVSARRGRATAHHRR